MRGRLMGIVLASSMVLVLSFVAGGVPVQAAGPVPAWQPSVRPMPTNFAPGDNSGNDRYEIRAINVGAPTDGSTPIVVRDALPAGITAQSVRTFMAQREGNSGKELSCNPVPTSVVTCTYDQAENGPVGTEFAIYVVIHVSVGAEASGTLHNSVTITGGGARWVTASTPTVISGKPAGFGYQMESMAINADGSVDTQAGSHPYEFTDVLKLNTTLNSHGSVLAAGGLVKDVSVDVPAGLLGNPTVVPQCSPKDFHDVASIYGNICPPDTQVGVFRVVGTQGYEPSGAVPTAIYNLVPPPGSPASFGFVIGSVTVTLSASVRTGGDYGITIDSRDIAEVIQPLELVTTFWGVPADPSHDGGRYDPVTEKYGVASEQSLKPFLRMPTSCNGPMVTTARLRSWADLKTWVSSTYESVDDGGSPAGLSGCEKLDFGPKIRVQSSVSAADSPLGYDVDVSLPQSEIATGLTEADLRNAVVTLPAGVSISPSAADGLGACTSAQIALYSSSQEACPDNSKVGDVEIDSPLVTFPLKGAIFIAQPYENPFDTLLALYVVADDKQSGITVKLAGRVTPDPVTGQLTSCKNSPPQQVLSRRFECALARNARKPPASMRTLC
jgi:hypothetical protein